MDRYTDGIVTTPINVADLSQLLNRSQEDINKVEYSNLLTSVGGLCTHPNINMWAKNRPMAELPMGEVTDDQRKNVYFGLNIPCYDSARELEEAIRSETADWKIILPTGGEKSPYSLAHFIGYNHKAHVDAWSMNGETGDESTGYSMNGIMGVNYYRNRDVMLKGVQVDVRWDREDTSVTDAIQYSNIKNSMLGGVTDIVLGRCYFGIMLVCEDSTYPAYWRTASSYLADEATDNSLQISSFLPDIMKSANQGIIKKWHIVPFVCDVKRTAFTDENMEGNFSIIGQKKYCMTAQYEAQGEPLGLGEDISLSINNGTLSVTFSKNDNESIELHELWAIVMHKKIWEGGDIYYPSGVDEDINTWRGGSIPFDDNKLYANSEGQEVAEALVFKNSNKVSMSGGSWGIDDGDTFTAQITMTPDGQGNVLGDANTHIILLIDYNYNRKNYRTEM